MNRFAVFALTLGLGALPACGGKARADAASSGGMGHGGSASRGGAGAIATGGMVEPVEPVEPVLLDDVFPWFTGTGESDFPNGQTDEVLHIVASETPGRATLSTHNLIDLLSYTEAIEFSARSSAPTRLLVSASNTIQDDDYFAALSAGAQPPVAPVDVGLDWQDYSVRLSDMKPAELGDADGVASFWLAFIVDHPGPVEVWIDHVRFEPKK